MWLQWLERRHRARKGEEWGERGIVRGEGRVGMQQVAARVVGV